MGTHGDLGNTLKWKPPFPDMTKVFKTHTKKAINDAVALINARKPCISTDGFHAYHILYSQANIEVRCHISMAGAASSEGAEGNPEKYAITQC